ncbi:thiol:disulfide interchange protein DsbA/DsbL [Beggiatoa leptomitoformis]|uniref:Thiol:disulfide interchange protein DsbA n=1 Tax=Beggiatoa leptomitoformis TaxID=288004 RepID=A0A2N9YAJ8_9GAMM|nr:thiol:disulfide interchange protein DsbA/DsbL [Beggiatoa leptomitoformis]ALG67129.1 thioredoxin domain-containing protein [Beggiatoa leptomitoformis]AUI67472.1 thioredoxin domain-containing protein [Beggiatoa leptomitoformis]
MKRWLLQLFTIGFIGINAVLPVAHAEEELYKDAYTLINPPQPTANSDKVEVAELFWYGCPHCFAFEPYLQAWSAKKADYIDYVHVPAVFNNNWALHAKAFYTAETLGVVSKLHTALFNAIHVQKRKLSDEASIMAVFTENGVSEDDFKKTFSSFSVDSKMRRANVLSVGYGATGVPAIVVNGKYLLSSDKAGGYDNLLKVVDYLAEKEYKAMKATAKPTTETTPKTVPETTPTPTPSAIEPTKPAEQK